MNLKRRRDQWALYRSHWVPSSASVPHGYSVQAYVGSIRADAEELPDSLRQKLTTAELAAIQRRVCMPARAARLASEAEAARRAQDPGWRLDSAAELLAEAAALSRSQPVRTARIQAVQRVLNAVQAQTEDGGRAVVKQSDVLHEALLAIGLAAQAVREGMLGSAPSTGARTTRTYSLWSQIVEAVGGAGSESLLTALQLQGFVKKRRR